MEVTPDIPDTEVAELPNDSISRVAFSPVANMLAVASWNNEVGLVHWLRATGADYLSGRCESTRSAMIDSREEWQCTRMMVLFWTCVGAK